MKRPKASAELCILAAGVTLAVACSGPGKYVWVDDYADTAQVEKPYVIVPGDTLQVRVFNQDQVSTRARVRSDGKITLPLLDDVTAVGLTPVELGAQLRERLRPFIKDPLVTVAVEETGPPNIYVIGEVVKPGAYPLDRASGVLPALVNAGGLTQDASTDRIFVLRQAPSVVRIRFTYEALVRLAGKAPAFRLRPGDIVVVE
jgi:polysaccharide export outer membrane protein